MWQWSRSAYELGSLESCSTWCEVLDKFCFQSGIMTWGRMLFIETDSWAKNEKTLQLLAVMGGAAPRSSARKALWPLVRRQLLQVLSSQMIFQGMVFSGICTDVGLRAWTVMDLGWVPAGICFWSQDLQLSESVVDRLQTVERRLSGNADDGLARLRGALPPCMLTSPQMFYPCALHFKWFEFVTQLWTIPQHRHWHPTLKG